MGIKVIGVSIESSPKFSDEKINEARASKKLAQISRSEWEAKQRENKAKEEANAVAQIIAKETAQRLQEIANQTALDEQEAQNKIMLSKAEAQRQEKILLAEADAEAIRVKAQAEAEAERELNEAGKTRPEWRTNIESIEANAGVIQGLGQIQYEITPELRAILGLVANSGGSNGANGSDLNSIIGLSMLQQQMNSVKDQNNH